VILRRETAGEVGTPEVLQDWLTARQMQHLVSSLAR
jgi:hypothetical protein